MSGFLQVRNILLVDPNAATLEMSESSGESSDDEIFGKDEWLHTDVFYDRETWQRC